MNDELVQHYLATTYTVLDGAGEVVASATIGERSPTIDALLKQHRAKTGVFITAWNPRSEPTDPDVNATAHDKLVRQMADLRLVGLPHEGRGADSSWTESGLFVLDLDLQRAVAFATSMGQNAVVLCERGREAALVLTPIMLG